MPSIFFSYSHVDENLRDQLEKHLSSLRRQGVISSWHDRQITAGADLGKAVDSHLDTADLILLLVSPDFIDSDYCYKREMNRALERHSRGEARVIPVILRPCDWHGLPFGGLLATPTDGRPITMWPNLDQAFLDVVTAIKRALEDLGKRSEPAPRGWTQAATEAIESFPQETIRSSNLRVKKQFTDLDKDRFTHEGFEYLAKYFENSLKELVSRNPGLDQTFRRVDADRFTAALYRAGDKVCRGSARLGGRSIGREGIEYSMTDDPHQSGMNEAVYVKADSQSMFFEALGMQSSGQPKDKLTYEGMAELFWAILVGPLQN